ncbi:Type IV secretion system protein VirB1 [Burkholderia sp. SJ98]|uniref:lytic transglycosylase domain-containing protein n=1 Tax=Caballeronia zhejiangensis TaxID=871203 RepID=UPI00025B9FF5|nr:lytic transglycosylase domain-containing protein [Caballeronia zhejiangensis]EKS72413.1 Type IV secretion system protein VirB1 [Burkholderia sp. SJ98]
MLARDMIMAVGLLTVHTIVDAYDARDAKTAVPPLPFEKLAAVCAPEVHPSTLKGILSTESAGNPYAIGVVGARLARQPRNLTEAIATARALERQGFNFSMGLGQVNRYNLSKYGERYETVFEPCRNLRAGSAILKDCYQRARARIPEEQQALRAAFSCYYSGNFTRGFRPDRAGQPSYVQKVVANATEATPAIPIVPAVRLDSNDAASVEKSAGPAHASTKRTARPAQWVIFADSRKQTDESTEYLANGAGETAAKVQLATPIDGAAGASSASARRLAAPASRDAEAVSVQRAPSSTNVTNEKSTPFVQFVN